MKLCDEETRKRSKGIPIISDGPTEHSRWSPIMDFKNDDANDWWYFQWLQTLPLEERKRRGLT